MRKELFERREDELTLELKSLEAERTTVSKRLSEFKKEVRFVRACIAISFYIQF